MTIGLDPAKATGTAGVATGADEKPPVAKTDATQVMQGGTAVADSIAPPVAPKPATKPRGVDLSSGIDAVQKDLAPRLDILRAMAIISQARSNIFQVIDRATMDAEHAKVASEPVPEKLEDQAEILMNRLRIGGTDRELVRRAVRHVLNNIEVPNVFSEHIGGDERINPETHSTQMAVTDPGQDHMLMTLADPEMLVGAWAHCEEIDRVTSTGEFSPHALPYGIPEPRKASLVRLFLAGDAPATLFYGRPNYTPSALGDKLPDGFDDSASAALVHNRKKAVNELAHIASAAFREGFDEVKVTMDLLNAEEATRFMQDVIKAVPVVLDPDNPHFFSAAFNLNQALKSLGILPPDAPRITGTPTPEQRQLMLKAALQAIDITKAGGFGKVTLDSASLEPPSYPLIEFFGVKNLLTWVSAAHQAGLETYVSGGMTSFHFPLLAMTGVDGVGVGTSIHESTSNPGKTGRMVPARVRDALGRRTKTEVETWPGQAMFIMRHLDQLASRGPLSEADSALQQRIFDIVAKFAEDTDTKLDFLKADRDAKLEALKGQKAALGDEGFKGASKKVTDTFKVDFEALIATQIANPDFVAASKAAVEDAVKAGHLMRPSRG